MTATVTDPRDGTATVTEGPVAVLFLLAESAADIMLDEGGAAIADE